PIHALPKLPCSERSVLRVSELADHKHRATFPQPPSDGRRAAMRSYMMVFTLLLNLSVLTDNVVAAELRSGYAADIPRVADLRDLGSAPGSTPIAISLTLNYQHERELRSL